MKKIYILIASVIAVLQVMGQYPSDLKTMEALKISKELTIDGKSSEAEWKDANMDVANFEILTGNNDPNDLYYEFKTLVSDQNLYFFINIEDDVVDFLPGDVVKDTYKWDCVELFIYGAANAIRPVSPTNVPEYVQMRIAPFTIPSDSVIEGHGYTVGDGADIWASDMRNKCLKTVNYKFVETSLGYNLEVAIPWSIFYTMTDSTFTPAYKKGDVLGFDVNVRDSDGGGKTQGVFSWNNATSKSEWSDLNYTGQLVLGGDINWDPEATAVKTLKTNRYSVYPNPVASQLYIKNLSGSETIKIRNVAGQIKAVYNNIESNSAIDMSAMSSGIYFVEVTTEDSFQQLFKVVK